MRDRGLVPLRRRERAALAPTANVQIAAEDAWALATEAVAAPYRAAPAAIVYRPFIEPPIPCWIALLWHPKAACRAHDLVEVARTVTPPL